MVANPLSVGSALIAPLSGANSVGKGGFGSGPADKIFRGYNSQLRDVI